MWPLKCYCLRHRMSSTHLMGTTLPQTLWHKFCACSDNKHPATLSFLIWYVQLPVTARSSEREYFENSDKIWHHFVMTVLVTPLLSLHHLPRKWLRSTPSDSYAAPVYLIVLQTMRDTIWHWRLLLQCEVQIMFQRMFQAICHLWLLLHSVTDWVERF